MITLNNKKKLPPAETATEMPAVQVNSCVR